MPVAWGRLIDMAISGSSLARRAASGERELPVHGATPGALETGLIGVFVAALKEAFDRDSRRLDLEREQVDGERERAERALRLELLRQAGDREIDRLRLVAGVAVASWIGTLFFASRVIGSGAAPRIALGLGGVLLLAALASAFAGQSRVADSLRRLNEITISTEASASGAAGKLAVWLVVTGLALAGLAVLL